MTGDVSAEVNHTGVTTTMLAQVVGLDLSLTSTGVAASRDDLFDVRAIRTSARGVQRLIHLRDQVLGYISSMIELAARPVALVVIEGYSLGVQRQSGQVAQALGELGGVIKVALDEHGLPFAVVPPATLKKYATGKGNAPKEAVLSAAVKRSGREFSSNDESDAFWLMAMGCDALGSPIVEVPKAQRAALDAVEWAPAFKGGV